MKASREDVLAAVERLRAEVVELRALAEQANVKSAAPKHGVKLCVVLPNGERVTGHTEQWVSALLLQLPADKREAAIDAIRKQTVAWSTPGSYILRAEGLGELVRTA